MRILKVPTLRMVCSGISMRFFSIVNPFFSSSTATLVLFTEPKSLPFSPAGTLNRISSASRRSFRPAASRRFSDFRFSMEARLCSSAARNSRVWGTASFLGRRKLRA